MSLSAGLHAALFVAAVLSLKPRDAHPSASAHRPAAAPVALVLSEGSGSANLFLPLSGSPTGRALPSGKRLPVPSSEKEPFQATLQHPLTAAPSAKHAERPSSALLPVSFFGPLTAAAGGGGNGTDQGAGEGAGQAGTTFFNVPARAHRVVYLIDASSSMGQGGAWHAARAELLKSIAALPPETSFQVLLYNSRPRCVLPRFPQWITRTPETVAAVAAALAQVHTEGTTDHAPALRMALALRPDTLYFLTDADDLTQEHLYLVNQVNQGRAAVHTIELTPHNRRRPGMPLQLMAGHNRGVYQAVDLQVP